jgi:hypothetical protein
MADAGEVKEWWKSKTIQLGAITFAMAALDALQSGVGWRQVVMAGVGALSIYLRTVTTQAVGK